MHLGHGHDKARHLWLNNLVDHRLEVLADDRWRVVHKALDWGWMYDGGDDVGVADIRPVERGRLNDLGDQRLNDCLCGIEQAEGSFF